MHESYPTATMHKHHVLHPARRTTHVTNHGRMAKYSPRPTPRDVAMRSLLDRMSRESSARARSSFHTTTWNELGAPGRSS